MEYEFNILYYINMYKKWWKTIVKFMVIAMFFTAIFSLLMPVNYVSTVTIISAGSAGGSSSSSIGKLLGISGLGGGDSSNDIIIALLNSKRMSRDIQSFLEFNKKQKFSYKVTTGEIKAGLEIDVRGNDPLFTEKVANFLVQNLDKINSELNITLSKPMVKVLDSAVYGERESRQTPRKILIAGMAAFLLMSLYVFFSDYLKKLKETA
jgi:uncharacterized protein involved in exopolysaccharide biosynthesis